MKKGIILLLCVLCVGCAMGGELVRDKQFAEYTQRLDDLESEYLQKQITYAQYLERKGQLDDQYNRQVLQRQEAIDNPR